MLAVIASARQTPSEAATAAACARPDTRPGVAPREQIHHCEDEKEGRNVDVAAGVRVVVLEIRADECDEHVHRGEAEQAPSRQWRGLSPAPDPPPGQRREPDEQEQAPQVSLRHAIEPGTSSVANVMPRTANRTADRSTTRRTRATYSVATDKREPQQVHGGRRHDGQQCASVATNRRSSAPAAATRKKRPMPDDARAATRRSTSTHRRGCLGAR